MAKRTKISTMANVRDGEYGLSVKVRGDSPQDYMKALRKFKRKVADSGLLKEIKDKQYYQKPSDKRREKKKAARIRQLKALAQQKKDLGY